MERSTRIALTAVGGSATLVAALGWLLTPPSQEDIANDCAAVVANMNGPLHADDPRPEECEGLNDDDYGLILMHHALEREGVWNEDGSVNMEELLNPDG